jgi:hypothetical protein
MTFPDWCKAHGTTPGKGRKRFVAAAVTERYGDRSRNASAISGSARRNFN